jgi:iron complex outermembrane receptor protein
MRQNRLALALAMAFPFVLISPALGQSQPPPQASDTPSSPAGNTPVKTLGIVSVTSGQPTSLPTQIPTTIEGVTREQIEETINATDSQDAIKYFPSLLVRKRYIGDYNHAVLSSRASGTGNSARSAVYADGMLLSNYLGNGATYTPRWGMVAPEEIERVDVMYGPFSAAYPGNSVGAVVDYVTRMPKQFEGHAKVSAFTQNFSLYNTNETYSGNQASASLGSRSGDWSWRIHLNRTDSQGQPLVFATRPLSTTAPGTNPAVSGAVLTPNNFGVNNFIVGTNTQYRTVQDQAKIKLAYDITPTLRASYILGYWMNTSDGNPQSYLRNAAGAPVYTGNVAINGNTYNLNSAFNASRESLAHTMHGLSLKSNTKGVWDWELAASLYDYGRDLQRATTLSSAASTTANPVSSSLNGGPGSLTNQNGTGWNNWSVRGTWRPQGMQGAHIVDFGLQQDNYQLRILRSSIAGNWLVDDPGATISDVGGKTQTQALYAQDTWRFAPKWKTVLGARVENWTANGGYTRLLGSTPVNHDSRDETFVSPKGALAYQWAPDTVLKGSVGRAVRMPTVQELYGAVTNANLSFVNDPNLRPEKSWTTELSIEKDLGNRLLRLTVFNEDTNDALYSQLIPGSTTVSRVQNVDAINTKGVEAAFTGQDLIRKGLDFSASITYADSRIIRNEALPSSVGKYQPRVPVWRATALTSYRFDDKLSATLGVRYSGDQFSQLNNSDINGFAYMGASRYLIVDVRSRYRIAKKTLAAIGIDNLTNEEYWNFHPYPKRTYVVEVKHSF